MDSGQSRRFIAEMNQPPPAPIKAALWMIGAIVSFSGMAIAGRAVQFELSTFEMMTYRSAIGFVLVLSLGAAFGTLSQITTRNMGLHVLRNIAHFTGQNLWFYAITISPLAVVFALEFTSPLWAMGLAAVFLRETLTRFRLLAGALGFVGVLVVAQPGSTPIDTGMITAALAAIGFAITAITTKHLTRTETITCILFYLTVMQLGFGLAISLADGHITLPSAQTAPWLVLIGICGLSAHFCLTTALRLAPASVVMTMDFARLPTIAILGAVFYAEPLTTSLFIGAGLILVANHINIKSTQYDGEKP
jgi:drug/metabolite transporter (DMT)-like permease